MMDIPRFVHEEDIPLIDEDYNDYEDDSRYDTPDKSRIEETSFIQDTEQPAVRLRQTQRQRQLCEGIIDLYRYLDVDPGNVDLVNTNLFKVEKSKSGVVGLYYKDDNGKTLVRLTKKRNGEFLAKSTFQKIFGGVE